MKPGLPELTVHRVLTALRGQQALPVHKGRRAIPDLLALTGHRVLTALRGQQELPVHKGRRVQPGPRAHKALKAMMGCLRMRLLLRMGLSAQRRHGWRH